MGCEPRPGLGDTRADPPAGYPSQSGRGPAKRAGLPEGAAITRRQLSRREATAPIDFSRRGTLRAVSGGSRLPLRCTGDADELFAGGDASKIKVRPARAHSAFCERADAAAPYAGAGPGETKERRARATRMTRPPACRLRSPGRDPPTRRSRLRRARAGADGRKATARGVRAAFRPAARLRVPGRRVTAAAADSPSRAGPRTEWVFQRRSHPGAAASGQRRVSKCRFCASSGGEV